MGDTGYNGHPFVKTPTLDEMAKDGFVFNRFYAAAPVCSPTRASVLTGRNPNRSKVTHHGRYMRGHLERPLPRMLQSAGYVTGMFGKWHVGSAQKGSPVNPGGLGFDEWLIGLNFFDKSPYLSRNGVVEHREGEVGSVIVIDETIAFLEKHKDGDDPMFAVAWFPSPHNPHAEVSSRPELYEGKKGRGYFQEITLLDEQLGRLRKWLRDEGLADNTLLWYCSDNGGLMKESSGGRGKKGDTWEGGLRVPGIIEWPGRKLSGSTDVPVVTSDIYPTLLALTGTTDATPLPLDGIDVRGVIEGKETKRPGIGFWLGIEGGQATWSDRLLKEIMDVQNVGGPFPAIPARMKKDIDEFPQFHEDLSRGNVAWLEWPWKVHRRSAMQYLLFNLEDDPLEAKDLAADPAHKERFEKLKITMREWQKSVIRSLNGKDYKAAAPVGDLGGLNLPGITINKEEHYLDVVSEVCLDGGILELIACTEDTREYKDHESLIAIQAQPRHVHIALLLVGAKAGHPAMRKPIDEAKTRWVDVPPHGGSVDVFLVFKDDEGKLVEHPINEFIKASEDGELEPEDVKFPTNTFLFAGSILHGEGEGPRRYLCDETGNFLTISTFGDEVLCLPGIHSHQNQLLMWEVNGEKLPEVGAKVILRLRPVLENAGK